MKISRLRLLGFKSFVEPTELLIEPGLTGVVGPNGCGKSNLLEALRWVMGETSHKSMRAAAMDDVIFSGTTSRPARFSAEVTMFLDNAERQAPAELNDRDQIEITRRIEREAGSAYRINGREARARDIKILFEDAATGARSPALVRQGQIGEIVNAKPEQRRRILEDAAGVAGLHSRRHEAELRLKGAEANLERLTDVLGQVTAQIDSLKRQARQARRYKELSEEIRRQEALVLHLHWTEAQGQVDSEEANLKDALTSLTAALTAESRAVKEDAERAEGLPPLREAEARAAALLQRLKVEKEAFEREATRAAERLEELEASVKHLDADILRERALIGEASELIAALDAEIAGLATTDESAAADEAEAERVHGEAAATLTGSEAALHDATQRLAEARAGRRSLEQSSNERRQAREKIERQLAALEAQERDAMARAPDVASLDQQAARADELAQRITAIEDDAAAAETEAAALARHVAGAREAAQAARLAVRAISTERETLARLLVPSRDSEIPAIVDQLRVAPGFETALGAALGDDLDAPAGDDAPIHWRLLESSQTDAKLPDGVEPLFAHVQAPSELTRRLRQIGIVADREQGDRLQPVLHPGQRLVSRNGDLWRWDGFVAAADGTTAAAQRLAQKNRLASIEYEEAEATEKADALVQSEAQAVAAHLAADARERTLRQTWRATQASLAEARDTLARIERTARDTEARLASVREAKQRTADDLADAREREAGDAAALAALPPIESLETAHADARRQAETHRNAVAMAMARVAELDRARKSRASRRAVATSELQRWHTRSTAAEAQIATLTERAGIARTQLAELADLPARLDARRQELLDQVQKAEIERQAAADRLAAAEGALRAVQQALKAAQADVGNERERRARVEARLEAARQRRQDEARRIRETLGVIPEGCLPLAGYEPDAALPDLEAAERQLAKSKTDRERLGGVNLQADDELVTLGEQFSTLEIERKDIEEAVAKLRTAIQQLNREAKKRLGEAFETVDGHFQRLFSTLFGGGEARLEMVEGEDPLESGLEIIAKPPGKKPATLSLLSGGEQTLTALSLIFAVFLTNPSPICVLDEVDAPLDDANVDRFCTLMEKMAEETATRFLVITHHPMTMARMNRLFGVTMVEKGVSQLVSVDLETAQRFLEAV